MLKRAWCILVEFRKSGALTLTTTTLNTATATCSSNLYGPMKGLCFLAVSVETRPSRSGVWIDNSELVRRPGPLPKLWKMLRKGGLVNTSPSSFPENGCAATPNHKPNRWCCCAVLRTGTVVEMSNFGPESSHFAPCRF